MGSNLQEIRKTDAAGRPSAAADRSSRSRAGTIRRTQLLHEADGFPSARTPNPRSLVTGFGIGLNKRTYYPGLPGIHHRRLTPAPRRCARTGDRTPRRAGAGS